MPPFDFEPFSPQTFSGLARLFPLPDLVMFPHALQPLHIFEPRYRAMLASAQRDDGLIAMTLLEQGEEEASSKVFPQIAQVVCLGRVVAATKLSDGRSNILLLGIQRARIIEELDIARPYRQAAVELLDDEYAIDDLQRQLLHDDIVATLDAWLPDALRQDEQFRAIFDTDLSLGTLCDIVANCLPIEVNIKQCLLTETDVEQRGLLLLETIDELNCEQGAFDLADSQHTFPPRFSDN
jgi:Lon protease-like protein